MSVFVWPVRVYWEDTDASGVVYHANYLRWLERARTEWLRARGLDQETMRTKLGIAFTLASLEIRYLKPARLDDALEVRTEVSEIKRASFGFRQTVVRTASGELLTEASVRAACVDAATFRPVPLPPIAV